MKKRKSIAEDKKKCLKKYCDEIFAEAAIVHIKLISRLIFFLSETLANRLLKD